MSTVTVFTAERMAEIEAQAVVGATIVDGHLIMTRHNGATFDAGVIDVSVIGDLAFSIDSETFYRYTDSASPLTLTAGIQTPMDATIMDTLDAEPSWAHWDTDADNRLVFDSDGIYDVLVYVVIDDPAESTGHSTIKISDSAGSGERQFDHVSGEAVRLDNQFTGLYEAGHAVRLDVKSSGNYDVSYAEIYIRKFNITMEPTVGTGGGGAGEGGSSAWGFNGTGSNVVGFSGTVSIDIVSQDHDGSLWPSGHDADELPAGLWHITGYVDVSFVAPATGYVSIIIQPPYDIGGADPATEGGQVQGRAYCDAVTALTIPFAGVYMNDVDWNPHITVTNSTDEDTNDTYVIMSGFGVSTPFDMSSGPGGG